MKQIYYVIQTLLRGRGSNIIKIISLGLSLTMSILLFSRVAYEQSFDTCYKDYDNLYQIWSVFTVKGEKYPPRHEKLPTPSFHKVGIEITASGWTVAFSGNAS